MQELVGKVAIITGGGTGIGSSIARTFAEEGASVVIADIEIERALKVVESIEARGGKGLAIKVDVTRYDDADQMVEKTLEKFGRIDILVNNAAIGTLSGSLTSPDHRLVENLTEEEWNKLMKVNLTGVFLCSKAVIPPMKRQRRGNIINISSRGAFVGCGTEGGAGPHYFASKAAVVNFTKTLAVQLGSYNIRANSIAPGAIPAADPNGSQSASFGQSLEEQAKTARMIPLGRVGTPKDIANVALFLASDKSSYVHGATIDVNGGWLMR